MSWSLRKQYVSEWQLRQEFSCKARIRSAATTGVRSIDMQFEIYPSGRLPVRSKTVKCGSTRATGECFP
jgi:hypothetical protein